MYMALFNSEQWDKVQIDHNAKGLKLRQNYSYTEPALLLWKGGGFKLYGIILQNNLTNKSARLFCVQLLILY